MYNCTGIKFPISRTNLLRSILCRKNHDWRDLQQWRIWNELGPTSIKFTWVHPLRNIVWRCNWIPCRRNSFRSRRSDRRHALPRILFMCLKSKPRAKSHKKISYRQKSSRSAADIREMKHINQTIAALQPPAFTLGAICRIWRPYRYDATARRLDRL